MHESVLGNHDIETGAEGSETEIVIVPFARTESLIE
jgi:hypothetical protein